MFETIKGPLADKTPQKAVIEVGGIGYRLCIPLSAFARLPEIGQEIRFFLSQIVREDSNTLYAFLVKEERDLFEVLITLSGIGPKTALAIIGHLEIGSFQKAVATADIRLLSKIPGVGKKTAERLVIEMRDRFKGISMKTSDDLAGDAMRALLNLGYTPFEAQRALEGLLGKETDLGKIITTALQKIGSG